MKLFDFMTHIAVGTPYAIYKPEPTESGLNDFVLIYEGTGKVESFQKYWNWLVYDFIIAEFGVAIYIEEGTENA